MWLRVPDVVIGKVLTMRQHMSSVFYIVLLQHCFTEMINLVMFGRHLSVIHAWMVLFGTAPSREVWGVRNTKWYRDGLDDQRSIHVITLSGLGLFTPIPLLPLLLLDSRCTSSSIFDDGVGGEEGSKG